MFGCPSLLRHRSWFRRVACLVLLLIPTSGRLVLAVPPEKQTAADDVASEQAPVVAEKLVRLNYLSTPWTSVLQGLADGTHSTLVMHSAPSGRFSRHDWKKHTRTEAVRILNRDLEKLGYRILEKGEFLTVIEVQQAHVDYERPVIGQSHHLATGHSAAAAPVSDPDEPLAEPRDLKRSDRRSVSALKSSDVRQSLSAKPRSTPDEAIDLADRSREHSVNRDRGQYQPDRRVQLVQHHEQVIEEHEEGPEAQTTTTKPVDQSSVTIEPRQRQAVDIAKQIHSAFGMRSKLSEAGPNDLPAFVVTHPVAPGEQGAPRSHFTIEIDADRNELILTSTEEQLPDLERLIRLLDRHPPRSGQKQELMAGPTAEVARKVHSPLSQLITERQAEQRNGRSGTGAPNGEQAVQQHPKLEHDDQPEVESVDELLSRGRRAREESAEAEPGAMNEEGTGSGSVNDQLPALLDTLKGDVTLEPLPDLDLLILRGNEKDVEAVMRVIHAIERMAEGSTPEIHLRRLEFVDSQSLATLLTTVYERMAGLRSSTAQRSEAQISVIPVVTPNAVLILAPANSLESVLQLTDELDQRIAPDHNVEVFPLQHAIASQVVETIEDFYPNDATLRPGLSTRVRASADVRTNSVIIQAQPRDLEEVRALIRKIDRNEAGSVSQAKIIKLKSANAEELAEFLQQAIQGILTGQTTTGAGGGVGFGGAGGQNSQQLRETKSVILEFLTHDQSTKDLVRSGLLTDVRVTADPRTNSLMVTAPMQSLVLMEELIRVLDLPSAAVAEIKVFTLKNADATDAVTLLETLFAEETDTQNGGVGVQLAGATDAGSNLVPLKFSTDGRTNSVVAIGGADALRIVEAILLRLDDNDSRNRKTTVVKLRNNPADEIATAINQYLQSQRDLAQIDPTRISTSQLLDQEVIVTPEPLSNSLIISATPRYHEEIMKLTEELDREPQQVAIQALLVEVTLEDNDEFGVELGFQDSILFDRSVIDNILTISETNTAPNGVQTTSQRIISQSSTPGFPFNNLPLGNNTSVHPGRVGSQGLSSFSLGRTNTDLGYGGMVLSASSDSVNVLVRALAARRNVRVLSRPSITVMDGQIAEIQVGQVVPVTDGASIGANGNVVPTITRDNAGIILTVTPRISVEGQVVMEVAAEKSQYTGQGVTILTDSNGGEVTSPVKDIATASTTVKVPDAQTIVLGGMITNSHDDIERKVPWLGDIPIVGTIFRYDSHSHRRTELLIFLTPRVIRCDEDSEQIKRIEAQRIHFFEDEAELIHGPIFAVPEESGPLEDPPQWETTIQARPITDSPVLAPKPVPHSESSPTLAPAPTLAPLNEGNDVFDSQPIQQMGGSAPASKSSASQAPMKTPSRPLFRRSAKTTR